MYGLVNQGLQDFVTRAGGDGLWRQVCAAVGVDVGVFVGMNTYPDAITYRLVEASGQAMDMPVDEVLGEFGRHWVLYTARSGYGAIFDTMGRTLVEFLTNLDMMHTRLSLSMPELRPPSFVCEPVDDGCIRLEYRSERDGLAAMVVGLLEGLAEMYGQDLVVDHTVDRGQGSDHDEFMLRPRAADSAENDGGTISCQHDMV